MGWSLSYRKQPEEQYVIDALLSAGKALNLSNLFESKCQYVLGMLRLGEYAEGNPGCKWSDAVANIAREKLLAPTLAGLAKFPEVSASDAALLDKAREGRNFIAHEGAAFGYTFGVTERAVADHMVKLRRAVAALAGGDHVVSGWVYEIEEKESSTGLMETYPEDAVEWVFSHADDLLSV